MFRPTTLALILLAVASPVVADEFQRVEKKEEFISLVQDRNLRRFGITVQVTEDGRIDGSAFGYEVEGDWQWEAGYFCRHIFWGGDSIGQNCQQVDVAGNKVRFTSDRGTGQSASLTLQ